MELKHSFNHPSLESEIQSLTEDATASNRFLIKMEIMKLSRNVHRIIDLRSFFKENCEKVTYKGISHFLDSSSKKEFYNEIKKYGGNYTLGVYEHIMQRAKARYKANAPLTVAPKKTEKISLTKFHLRKDERLYFIKKISMFYNSPEKMSRSAFENFAIEGITTDISSNGLSIKIAKENIRRTEGLIYIWMHGIEAEFKFSERVIITYQIKKIFEKNDHVYLCLEYYSQQFSKIKNEFAAFVKNYIETQKKRNNVPVENTVNAIKVKASEQFIIARLSSLPIFLMQQNGTWLPAAQFQTKNNSEIGFIASKNCNKDFLHSLCLLPSVQSKISLEERFHDYLFLMPIKDKNNKTYYVALPHKEVTDNAVMKKIAGIAHKQNKLKLYRIDGNTTLPEEQYHVPSSLPSSAGEAFENMNQPPIARARAVSKLLKRMLVLSDFSDAIDYLNLLHDGCHKHANAINLSDHILKNPVKDIDIYNALAETNDFRSEDRFICNMNLLIQKKAFKTDDFVAGTTINISTKGLKIKLSKIMELNIGDKILVHLPELPGNDENGAKYQPYNVAGKDSELEYRLCIEGKAADHAGRKIIREYINKNINNLQAMGHKNEIYGLSRALRNIFANNIHLPYGIAAKENSTRYIKYIALSENSDIPAINGNGENGMLDLMGTNAFKGAITNKIEFINKETPYERLYFIIMPRIRSNGEHYFFIKQLKEAATGDELNKLIQEFKNIGQPKILRINATKKSRVFNKYFRDEMSYLTKFAGSKVEDINAELRNTLGIFEIADVTELIC